MLIMSKRKEKQRIKTLVLGLEKLIQASAKSKDFELLYKLQKTKKTAEKTLKTYTKPYPYEQTQLTIFVFLA